MDGTGAQLDPYRITSKEDFMSLCAISESTGLRDKHMVLSADINLSGFSFNALKTDSKNSVFEGNGFTISNASYNKGFFNSCTVRNLNLHNPILTSTGSLSSFLCYSTANASNVHITGAVANLSGDLVFGGFSPQTQSEYFLKYCSLEAIINVKDDLYTGGYIGGFFADFASDGKAEHCSFRGSIYAPTCVVGGFYARCSSDRGGGGYANNVVVVLDKMTCRGNGSSFFGGYQSYDEYVRLDNCVAICHEVTYTGSTPPFLFSNSPTLSASGGASKNIYSYKGGIVNGVVTDLSRGNSRLDGLPLNLSEAVSKPFYESMLPLGWSFGKVWGIQSGLDYPRLLSRGNPESILGLPFQSVKWYVFVKESTSGSMFYNGKIYESLKKGVMISMFESNVSETVTQVYGGERVPDNRGQIFVYLASGVQDPEYPGGYGDYKPDTSRRVTLRPDRSINVNFYYAELDLPNYNYLARVSLPEGMAHIAVLKEEDTSSVKMQMHDGTICSLPLVELDDIQASDIRVSTKNGIFALKKIELYD